MRAGTAPALLATLLTVAWARGGDPSSTRATATQSPGPSSTANAGPTPRPTAGTAGPVDETPVSDIPSRGEPLDPNGRYYGFVQSFDFDAEPATMELDVAAFLTGKEANRAAVETGRYPRAKPFSTTTTHETAAPVPERCRWPGKSRCSSSTVEASSARTPNPTSTSWRRLLSDVGPPEFYGSSSSLFDVVPRVNRAVRIREQFVP